MKLFGFRGRRKDEGREAPPELLREAPQFEGDSEPELPSLQDESLSLDLPQLKEEGVEEVPQEREEAPESPPAPSAEGSGGEEASEVLSVFKEERAEDFSSSPLARKLEEVKAAELLRECREVAERLSILRRR